MAIYEGITTVNLIAGEDLRDSANLLLMLAGGGRVVKTIANTDIAIGILAENPSSAEDTTGFSVPVVMLGGIVKVKSGSNIAANKFIVTDSLAPGHVNDASTLTAGVFSAGRSLESAETGDVFNMVAHTLLG